MRLLLCSILLSAVVAGCGLFASSNIIKPLSPGESFSIPVTAAKIDDQLADFGTSGFEAAPGGAPDMVIMVPASNKPTVVEVRKTKRSVVDKALTNRPAYEVKSDSKGVTAAQPKQTLWWKWLLAVSILALFVVAVVLAIAKRMAGSSPWLTVVRLFKRK